MNVEKGETDRPEQVVIIGKRTQVENRKDCNALFIKGHSSSEIGV